MQRAHPYMPNSVPALKAEMLSAIGAASIEEFFGQIPEEHRYRKALNLPPALTSEPALHGGTFSIRWQEQDVRAEPGFLGGGCWPHYVPAICDEIVGRTEFLTPVWGTASSDFGRNQAWFEYASQLGELVGMDLVGLPVYSWGCAAGHAIRMAARMTGRQRGPDPRLVDPERLSVIRNYCEPPEWPSISTSCWSTTSRRPA